MENAPRQPDAPPRQPLSPVASATIAALLTAVILTTLGSLSLVAAKQAMERNPTAGNAPLAATAAGSIDASAFAMAGVADSTAATRFAQVERTVAAATAALGTSAGIEVLAVRGDSMVVVADGATPSRRGTTEPVPPEARAAWSAGRVSRVAGRDYADGGARRVLAPVRAADGSVAGVVSVTTNAAYTAPIDREFRSAIVAGLAVILGLTALAGIAVHRAEKIRKDSASQLMAAKEAAEATARSRGEFLANMSHEIRTPLHGVLGMTEALLATPHTEADRRSLAVINRSASSLLGILNDILDFSKLEAGRVDLINAPFDPRALVDDVTDLFAVRAEEKGLDLAVDETSRCDQWPVGDSSRIRQVLLNLVGNAVKFTEAGSVEVGLSTVAIGRRTVAMRIAVRDTGIGIAPDLQQRVFEQFSQAESSTARRFGGTGLGLTISRQLVLLMGGTISVTSQPGAGSEFVVALQLPAAAARGEGPVAQPFAAGERVIVCTKGAGTLKSLTNLCTRERLLVTVCATIDDVQRSLKSGERAAAVFCDVDATDAMPHPLGNGSIPLVLLTTVHHPLNNSTLSSLGAAAQLRRPVRQDHFSALAADLVAGRLRVPAREQPLPAAPAAPAAAPMRPAANAATPAVTVAPASTATRPSGPDGPARRVLVVDDVDLNLIVAKAMLGSLGASVVTAGGGEQALEVLARDQVDLILMDCHMPGLDGYEVTKRVRAAAGPNRETPIVALSASAFAEDRERALSSGMNDFATKPIELESLRAVLTRWTTRSEAGAATGA
jgi:signal transduction histidine kinase/CheY-like chemotaxis protein